MSRFTRRVRRDSDAGRTEQSRRKFVKRHDRHIRARKVLLEIERASLTARERLERALAIRSIEIGGLPTVDEAARVAAREFRASVDHPEIVGLVVAMRETGGIPEDWDPIL